MKDKLQSLLIAIGILFSAGQINGATVFPIATNAAQAEASGGIAASGTNYLASILSGTNVCTQLLSTNGALIGALLTNGHSKASANFADGSSAGGKFPSVAFCSSNYMQIWYDTAANLGYGRIIRPDGSAAGAAFQLSPNTNMVPQALASDHTNFLVVLQDFNRNIYGQFVTSGGALSGSAFLISSQVDNGESEAVIFGKTNYLVIFSSQNVTNNGNTNLIYGALISPSGSASSPFQIGQTPSPDWSFNAVAFDGTNYLAAWQWDPYPETGGTVTNWEIFGRFVSQTGTLPGNELQLVTEVGNDQAPALAFDGFEYLMAWSHGLYVTSNINTHFIFLDQTASPIGSEFSVFTAQGSNKPAFPFSGLLFDAGRFVVADTLTTSNFTSGEVFGAFLSRLPTLTPGNHSGSQFSLTLTGTPGANYAIQMTTNLPTTNWTALVTNTATNGSFSFTDTHATNQSRYYRGVTQ